MEVLLQVDDADLAIQVEPSHTVASLVAALGPGRDSGAQLVRVATGELLDPDEPVGDIGLLSGERLVLVDRPAPAPSKPGRLGPAPPAGRTGRAGARGGGTTGRVESADDRGGSGWVERPDRRAGGSAGRVSTGSDRAPCRLVVGSGPDLGASVELSPVIGEVVVGRDRTCDLTLTDPCASRLHLVVTPDPTEVSERGRGGVRPLAVVVPSTEARSPVLVNGSAIDRPTSIGPGDVVRVGATTLRVEHNPGDQAGPGIGGGPAHGHGRGSVPLGQVPFHRAPYYPCPVSDRRFPPLGDIPERAETPRFAFLAALAPLALGIALAVLYSPRMLFIAVFSPVMAVAGYVEARRRNKARYGASAERYRRRLAERRAELEAAVADERIRRNASAPDLADLADRARFRTVELWVRDRRSPDFATLRLGLGDVEPAVTIDAETRGDEALRDELDTAMQQFAVVADVPVTVDLTSDVVVGIVGPGADTTALCASLVTQAACLHSPEDLVVVAAVAPERQMGRWLRWLPHLRSPSSPLAGTHLAQAGPAGDELLRELVAVAEHRAGSARRSTERHWPHVLAVLDQAIEPEPAVLSRLLDVAGDGGVSVVWLSGSARRVPRQATVTLTCHTVLDPEPSVVAWTDPDRPNQAIEIDRLTPARATTIARSLAPIRDASSATATSAVPRTVTLHEAFGTAEIDPGWVIDRWRDDRGHSLVAPVGWSVAGPLVLDLVEHGPHGLIGGTSGSGKSELMMSIVAGLVAHNPPTAVNLLFVDYKGGASSSPFCDLPHTVGYVTNLDAMLARRALVSLRAELDRRMDLLEGRAKDLAELRERHPADAPASLVIVVDEFATLVTEVPEFVAGIVDIAQRGRSLGIHLLLATQRPSGAVNENILANTNLRISLRTVDGADSTGIIGTPDAAAIPTPLRGRAFARFGPGELVPFQSGWTGAPLLAETGPPPILVRSLDASMTPGPVGARDDRRPGRGRAGTASTERTQLDGLLDAVQSAAADLGLAPGRTPWLPELPEVLDLDDLWSPRPGRPAASDRDGHGARCRGERWPIVVGLEDDPAGQAQHPAIVDLAAGGLAVFGTGGSGKTVTLQTLAHSVARRPPGPGPGPDDRNLDGVDLGDPDEDVEIVVLDFASRQLVTLAALPACRAVATADDLEAVTRIIALLDATLGDRRSAIATAAASGSPAPPFPPVLLLVDDYGNLAQTFDGPGVGSAIYSWLETLNRIITDGRQVGIYTALTATRRSAVKASVLSAIGNRLVLRQAEPSAYTDHGLPTGLVGDAPLPPGRGFLNGPRLVQVAQVDPTSRPHGEPAANRPGSGPIWRPHGEPAAAPTGPGPRSEGGGVIVGPLPTEVELLEPAADPLLVPIGRTDLTLDPAVLDLTVNNAMILGDPRSGRSNALAVVAHHLASGGQRVWVVGPAHSPLTSFEKAMGSAFGRAPDVEPVLDEVAVAADPSPVAEPPPWLLVDDFDLLDDPALDQPFGRLLDLGVRFVAVTSGVRSYTTNPLGAELRRARSVLYLQPPDARSAQEVVGVAAPLRPGLPLPPGRAMLAVNRRAAVVHVSRWTP